MAPMGTIVARAPWAVNLYSRRYAGAFKEPEEHASCLGKVEYDVKVPRGLSDDDLATIEKLCKYSPVAGMLMESISVGGEVTRAA